MLLPYFFVLSYKVLEDDEQHNDRKIRRPTPLYVGPVLSDLSDALANLFWTARVTSVLLHLFGVALHAYLTVTC